MPYCTQADIVAAYGIEEVLKAQPLASPPVDPPVIDSAAVAAAIEAATVEIDSYVMARYRLPLADELAARLKNRCVDVAMWHLSMSTSGDDDLKRKRYDDAIAWLKMLAMGKVVLTPRPQAQIESEEKREFQLPTNYLSGSDYWRKRFGGYKDGY